LFLKFMKRLSTKQTLASLMGVATALAFPATASAACDINQGVSGGASCAQGSAPSGGPGGLLGLVGNITKTLLIVIGAIAVIMIVIGGLRYILSQGDENGLRGAKDTIIYSVVGLVVALLAYAIVSFVIGLF
jgi:hypothetical protein